LNLNLNLEFYFFLSLDIFFLFSYIDNNMPKTHIKNVNRFRILRLALLGVAVVFLGILTTLLLQHAPQLKVQPKDILANTNSLNVAVTGGTATYTTITSGTMNLTSLYIGGTAVTATAAELNKMVGIGATSVSAQLSLKAPLASPTFTGTVNGITATMVGLGNVDNTSDVNKPVSTAQQTALNLKAPLASPIFTGSVTMPGTGIWNSSGNVGIGTTNPNENLVVSGSDSTMPAVGSHGGNFAVLTSNARGLVSGNLNTGNYFMQVQRTDGTATAYNLLLQPNSGNVGIGTTTPAQKLEVSGAAMRLRITDTGVANASWDLLAQTGNTTKLFRIYDPANSADRLVIDNSGNVGIGNTTPGAKLAVSGAITTTSYLTATTGVVTGNIYPLSDSTTAVQINKADSSTNILNVDTTNSRVGIGTTAPAQKLDIVGSVQSSVQFLSSTADSATTPGFAWGADPNSGFFNAAADTVGFTTNGTERMRIGSTGNVGIGTTNPTYKLTVAGSLYAGGSSRRYKENITPLEVDSSKIYSLDPVSFDYKPQYKSFGKDLGGGRQIGLIAEDVNKVIPELSIKLNGVISNVDYEKLSVLLLAEMKNQKKEMESQKKEINSLQSTVQELQTELKLLESKLK